MRKLMKGKFPWIIIISTLIVSVLFTIFVVAGHGTTNNMQEITRATTNFTQTISK